jgi:hypothetical protein
MVRSNTGGADRHGDGLFLERRFRAGAGREQGMAPGCPRQRPEHSPLSGRRRGRRNLISHLIGGQGIEGGGNSIHAWCLATPSVLRLDSRANTPCRSGHQRADMGDDVRSRQRTIVDPQFPSRFGIPAGGSIPFSR